MSAPTYGFYGRLSSSFPSQMIVDVSEICNLECIHCPHPDFKKSHHYDNRNVPLELNEKMAKEVGEHGVGITQYIRYTSNGEPLAHGKIYEMLTQSVKHSNTTVCLTTNGTMLTQKNIERLLDTGVNLIDISIDAFEDDTYSKIRVKGDLRLTRGNVINLIRARAQMRPTLKVVVSFVEQPHNTSEAVLFKNFWESEGADFVVIRKLHSASGAVEGIAEKIKVTTQEARRPCLYPWERMSLTPKGYLAFCPSDWVHGSEVADYRTTSIREVWGSEFYNQLRRAHLTNNFKNYAFCGQCPDWCQTTWPDRGRSYADMVEEFVAKV